MFQTIVQLLEDLPRICFLLWTKGCISVVKPCSWFWNTWLQNKVEGLRTIHDHPKSIPRNPEHSRNNNSAQDQIWPTRGVNINGAFKYVCLSISSGAYFWHGHFVWCTKQSNITHTFLPFDAAKNWKSCPSWECPGKQQTSLLPVSSWFRWISHLSGHESEKCECMLPSASIATSSDGRIVGDRVREFIWHQL